MWPYGVVVSKEDGNCITVHTIASLILLIKINVLFVYCNLPTKKVIENLINFFVNLYKTLTNQDFFTATLTYAHLISLDNYIDTEILPATSYLPQEPHTPTKDTDNQRDPATQNTPPLP